MLKKLSNKGANMNTACLTAEQYGHLMSTSTSRQPVTVAGGR